MFVLNINYTSILVHSSLTNNCVQFKQWSKTVYLIPKQAKVHFKNEQCCVDEFEVWCLTKQSKTERESVIYIIAQYTISNPRVKSLCTLRVM